jgi:hypothetical protein
VSFTTSFLAHPAPLLLDEDGRAVAEVGAEVVGAPTELVACPYPDHRSGLPMNRSALRQMATVWPAVLERIAAYAGPGPVTVRGAFGGALTGTSAVIHHAVVSPGEPVPRAVAATYKTCLGLTQVLAALCLLDPDLGESPLRALGDADAFFSLLDDGRWLVGQVEVCAGPRALIGEVFEALATGGGPQPPWADEARWASGLLGAALLAAPLPDPTAPRLARLLGPKGPSWTRALFAAPGRRPGAVGWWFEPGALRTSVEGFATSLQGLSPGEVERATERRLEEGWTPN